MASMINDSTGVYYYNWYQIGSNAIYGQYNVTVTASDGDIDSVFSDKFFVMPWNIQDEVRTLAGMTLKDIDDDDLSLIVWNAFRETINEVMEYHYHEKLCCCTNGVCSCGNIECSCDCGCQGLCSSPICSDQGRSYKLKHTPIGDWQIDTHVRGCECQDANDECHNDICGIWMDHNGVCSDVAVKVINATCGEIEVYQVDCATNIPSNNWGIYINYHSTWRTYSLEIFKKAVMYLAYYELAMREFLQSKKVSGCDEKARLGVLDRIHSKYRDKLDEIRRPMLGGVK
jgi:hypothetical protein